MIRGSVDTVSSKRVTGWIYSDESKEPLTVEAQINDQVVGRAVANLLRPDLAEAGFGGGKCGFEIRFQNDVDMLYLPFVQVMLAGSDLELRRWAGAGFREYFLALYQKYPRAGRPASVFGGLWTDRTDAAALLKGRSDIGVLAQAEANCVARFIQDGVVVVTRADSMNGGNSCKSKRPERVAVLADTMFDDGVLRVARAILDDHPVAVRADVLESEEETFSQLSAVEDLPSPAECVGVVFPSSDRAIAVDVVRGGHRFPEFLPDGLSRWTHAAAHRITSASLSPDLPVDRHLIERRNALLIGPGALFRIRANKSGAALRVLALPARQSLLRFHQKAPSGEIAHESGARIWV
jgi:hypothetical protein